ncbi:unnamed protein product [Sympodiomycopsis kandeliae]
MVPSRGAGHQGKRGDDEQSPLLGSHGAQNPRYVNESHTQLQSQSAISPPADEERQRSPEEDREEKKATPLPKMQLFVICVMRLSEPICFTVIFPFVSSQIKAALPNVPKSQIGYYAGLIESMFALVQFCTVFLWGRLSDSIGRKPILLIGMAGTFFSINAFGLAKNLPSMIAARCIAGLFNANVSVIKSVLGEITDESNSPRAFSLLPLMFAIGTIVGPWLGGTLANPVEQYPQIFGNSQFLKEYPFYLPCGVASLYILFSFSVGSLFLKETLQSKVEKVEASRHRHDAEDHEGQDHQGDNERTRLLHAQQAESLEQSANNQETQRPNVRSLLKPEIIKILSTQMILNLQNISFTSVLPLFCYEPVSDGGVSFSGADIGHIMAFNGVLAIIIQSIIFPLVEKRMGGPLPVYRLGLVFYIPSFLMFPAAHLAAQYSTQNRLLTWAAFAVGIVFKALAGMSIVCATLLINNSSPTRSTLGSLNGLSQACGSLARAIGPILSTSLFAFSVTHRYFGYLVWIVLVGIATITWLLSFRISTNRRAAPPE